MPPRVKSDICAKLNPGFNLFINFHNRPHTPFLQLIFLTGLPGSLGEYHHYDGFSHNHDDDVEGIYCQEYRHQLGTGNDEVKC